jgi:hypothetical protein
MICMPLGKNHSYHVILCKHNTGGHLWVSKLVEPHKFKRRARLGARAVAVSRSVLTVSYFTKFNDVVGNWLLDSGGFGREFRSMLSRA